MLSLFHSPKIFDNTLSKLIIMTEADKAALFTEIVLQTFRLGGQLSSEGDKMAETLDITSARWKILGAIKLAGTPQTVPQIAHTMGLTRQAVQRLVDVMQQDGFVEFIDNRQHKRSRLIQLSTQGKKTYTELDHMQQLWAEQRSSNLSVNALQTTLQTLKAISQELDSKTWPD